MPKILKIEDAKIVTESGKRITRYIFNDDKIVRVDTNTDKVITKNVPKEYLNLISIYSTNLEVKAKKEEEEEEEEEYSDRIEAIRSGKGAGLGVFLGILTKFTIIGPIIAGFCSFSFLKDMCSEDYLKNADVKDINFRKGFYGMAVFNVFVAIACCAQWKTDMISVLEGEPTKQSENGHVCFKVWFWVFFVYYILYFFASMARASY